MKLVDVAPERLKWSSTVFFRNHSSSKKESLKKTLNFLRQLHQFARRVEGNQLKNVRRVTQEAIEISGRRKNGHAHS